MSNEKFETMASELKRAKADVDEAKKKLEAMPAAPRVVAVLEIKRLLGLLEEHADTVTRATVALNDAKSYLDACRAKQMSCQDRILKILEETEW